MKMSYKLILFLCILQQTRVYSQHINPFESIGKKGKITTAYGNRFIETFDNDSIQRIGSVLMNIRTHKIVKLLNSKDIFNKFSDNSSSSRWMSVDPHADNYANMSPYTGMGNNPILYTDPDGRDLIIRGSNSLQDNYARLLSKTTGYNISIDHKSGKLSVGDAIGGAANTSKVLASLVTDVSTSEKVYSYDLVGEKGDNDAVWIDNYELGQVDVADLNKMGTDGDNALLAGALGHFIAEVAGTDNYADVGSRKGKFEKAHDIGLAKEGEIVGGMLGIGTNPRQTQQTREAKGEALYDYVYGSGGQTKRYTLGQKITGMEEVSTTVVIGGLTFPATEKKSQKNGILTKVIK